MSKFTTGRKHLEDLEKRVAVLDGGPVSDRSDIGRMVLDGLFLRVATLEREKGLSPENKPLPTGLKIFKSLKERVTVLENA